MGDERLIDRYEPNDDVTARSDNINSPVPVACLRICISSLARLLCFFYALIRYLEIITYIFLGNRRERGTDHILRIEIHVKIMGKCQ